MKEIIHVTPLPDMWLDVEFSTGERRLFDLKRVMRGSLFEALRDEDLFRQVQVEKYFGGLVWPNGADLCPDMIFMNSEPAKVSATV